MVLLPLIVSVWPVVDNVNVLAEIEHDKRMQYIQSSVAVNVSLVVAIGLEYFGAVLVYVAVWNGIPQNNSPSPSSERGGFLMGL